MRFDCVVVGGGPAGSILAFDLASAGAKVAILEEHADVGRPVHCSGIVSPATVRAAGYPSERCRVLKEALVYPPSGEPLRLRSKSPRAILIDRADFDKFLWERAEGAGALAKNGVVYVSHSHGSGTVAVKSTGGDFDASYLVGADGVSSSVAKNEGFPALPLLLPTVGVDIPRRLVGDADIRMDVGRSVAPGFFAWAIQGEKSTRVQLGTTDGRARARLGDYLKRLGAGDVVDSWHAGVIPLSARPEFARGRVALVGDAAGQVKPLSGGGMHPLIAAARELSRALLTQGFGMPASDAYSQAVASGIGAELRRGEALRRAYTKVSDATLCRAFEMFRKEGVMATIVEGGDIDHPHELAAALLRKHPEFLALAPMLARDILS